MSITDAYIIELVEQVLDAAGGHRPPLAPNTDGFLNCEDTIDDVRRHLIVWSTEAQVEGDRATYDLIGDALDELNRATQDAGWAAFDTGDDPRT